MSWEVRSMKSGTSFFNRSYSLHLLRRFWPLWALWLALLILIGPVLLGSAPPESFGTPAEYVNNLNRTILESGRILAFLSILAGPLVAMAMLSWLYSPRICGMVNSLPMKRETVWFTSVLTGLLPMLAADLLVFLIILAGFGGRAGVETAHVWTWLKLVVLGNTAFYGMACFCGVLTGNVLVLPAVYLVLGCTASVAESTARALLGDLVYGYTYDSLWLHGLSPFLHLTTVLHFVGRLPGCAITLRSPAVSRMHLRLSRVSDGVLFEDLGAKNAAMYRGRPIRGQVVLAPGDSVGVCGIRLTVVELGAMDGCGTERIL